MSCEENSKWQPERPGEDKCRAVEAEIERGIYTREQHRETPASGRAKQPENPIKKLKQNSRGLTKWKEKG